MDQEYFTFLDIHDVLAHLLDFYHLSVSEPTWRRWIREGLAPPPIRVGRRLSRWRCEEIDQWARTQYEQKRSSNETVSTRSGNG